MCRLLHLTHRASHVPRPSYSTQHSTISLIARLSYVWRMADPARAGREFRSRVGRRRGDLKDLLHPQDNQPHLCLFVSLPMRARTTSVQPVCPGMGWAGGQGEEGVLLDKGDRGVDKDHRDRSAPSLSLPYSPFLALLLSLTHRNTTSDHHYLIYTHDPRHTRARYCLSPRSRTRKSAAAHTS